MYSMYSMEIPYGMLASIASLISFLPIVYTIVKTKNTSNFVWSALLLAFISLSLRMIEGIQLGSMSLVFNTAVFIVFYIIIIGIKLLY